MPDEIKWVGKRGKPRMNRRRLQREVKAYAAAIRQDFLCGYCAVVPLTAEEQCRVMRSG